MRFRAGGVAMPLDRDDAQGASQRSLILRRGKANNALVFSSSQAIKQCPEIPLRTVLAH